MYCLSYSFKKHNKIVIAEMKSWNSVAFHLPLKVKIPILFIRYVHGPSKAYTYKFERARNVYFD